MSTVKSIIIKDVKKEIIELNMIEHATSKYNEKTAKINRMIFGSDYLIQYNCDLHGFGLKTRSTHKFI